MLRPLLAALAVQMNKRLEKQWKVTIAVLNEARSSLQESEEIEKFINEYEEFLEHNELELALDMLEEAGLEARHKPSRDFWFNLKKAAEIMGLENRYDFYREKMRNS